MTHPLVSDLEHISAHSAEWVEDLRGARLLVTGGTGFFGKWLLESFVWMNARHQLGARAVVLTRSAESFRKQAPTLASEKALSFHEGDVRDFIFPTGDFSHVIHAATPSGAKPGAVAAEEMLDLIVQGTRHTLDFARHSGACRFLLTSSGAVYGRQPPELDQLDEEFCGAPNHLDSRWVYGEGKRVAEQLCAIYHESHRLETKIVRCFTFVGPFLPLDVHFAIGNFIRDGLAGGPIHVGGDGTPYRSYLHAADLMIWLWTILLRGRAMRPYNVGSSAGMTIADIAQEVASCFGTEVQIAGQAIPGKPAERYVPSTARAEQELGLQTWIDFKDALARTVRWHRRAQV